MVLELHTKQSERVLINAAIMIVANRSTANQLTA